MSEFLNDAAKHALYRRRLREAIDQLEREGYRADPATVERLRKAFRGHLPAGRPARRKSAGR